MNNSTTATSDFHNPSGAIAYRASYAKLPSEHYELCVLQRWIGSATPGLSSGEFTETVHGLEAATARVEELKQEALSIHVMRLRNSGTRINKPAAIWYADDYKGKRTA